MLPDLEKIINGILPDVAWDEGGAGATADRFLRYLLEFRPGEMPRMTDFEFGDNQLIVASPIEFSSMCKHHLLPFLGYAHVGYVSDGRILGLSKIPRLVDWIAKRPSTQEEMTASVVHWMRKLIAPKGVHVIVEAIHTCACARGVHKTGLWMKTSLPTGVFRDNAVTRQEFMALVSLQGGK